MCMPKRMGVPCSKSEFAWFVEFLQCLGLKERMLSIAAWNDLAWNQIAGWFQITVHIGGHEQDFDSFLDV